MPCSNRGCCASETEGLSNFCLESWVSSWSHYTNDAEMLCKNKPLCEDFSSQSFRGSAKSRNPADCPPFTTWWLVAKTLFQLSKWFITHPHNNLHGCVCLQYVCAVISGNNSLCSSFIMRKTHSLGLLADGWTRVQFGQDVLGVQRWHSCSTVKQSCRTDVRELLLNQR